VLEAFYAEDYVRVATATALDYDDACEAVDEALAVAWREGVPSRGRDALVSDVSSRARVIARRARRARRREWHAARRLDLAAGAAPDAAAVAVAVDVRSVLATLSRRQRQVVALHYMVDIPVDEVARLLGVSQSTVKTMLARGRAHLACRLDRPHSSGRSES
jgi:RNA polymerase sigma-70 factor (ECF subfamily)